MSIKKNNFLDYAIFSESLSSIPEKKALTINTINQYSYCIAEEDQLYKKSLQSSDVLLPDGISIVLAAQFLNKTRLTKIAGADIHEYMLEKMNKISGRCFYLGASATTLDLIRKRVSSAYPNVSVSSFSPPYKAIFTAGDNRCMINAVNNFQPDVLFVGMTAPKQEKWIYQHKQDLDVNVICAIGAVFDFYAGVIKRPGNIWISSGLEWMGRLLKEPRRLYKRYLYYGPVFIYLMLRAKMKQVSLS